MRAPPTARAAGSTTPVVGVWSNDCASSILNSSNIFCSTLNLTPGNQFTIQVNVTGAPSFNAFEFSLYYDPHYLQAVAIDLTGITGNPTVFGNKAQGITEDLSRPGAVYISVIALGGAGTFNGGSGTLANITFKIIATGVSPLTLSAGMTAPSGFAQDGKGGKPDFTHLVNTNNAGQTYYVGVDTTDGYFTDVSKLGPVASFTFNPQPAEQGHTVTFNATASFDADHPTPGGIIWYAWDFGDGQSENDSVPVAHHLYISPADTKYLGNFTVRLTVADRDDGFEGMIAQRMEIVPPPLHDIAIYGITVTPVAVSPGQKLNVQVIVKNQGTFREDYNLTVTFGPPTTPVGSSTGRGLAPSVTATYQYPINTTGLSPNTYTVVAIVKAAIDNDTSNDVGKAVFLVAWPSNAPFLYLLSGGGGLVAIVSATGILLRRRRLKLAEIEESAKPNTRRKSR